MNTVTQLNKIINVQQFKYIFMNTLDIYMYFKRENLHASPANFITKETE